MDGEIVYTEGEIDEVRIIPDFLPPPSELAFKEDMVKVTIALSGAVSSFSSARRPSIRFRIRI
jgi:hypothetical protein